MVVFFAGYNERSNKQSSKSVNKNSSCFHRIKLNDLNGIKRKKASKSANVNCDLNQSFPCITHCSHRHSSAYRFHIELNKPTSIISPM